MLFQLYVGSDNETGQIDRAAIERAAGQKFPGFTLIDALGYWQGKSEKSLIVQIETLDRKAVIALALELKKDLRQEAIGLQELPSLSFV